MESCYRSFQFRVHRRNGSSSPHSACCPYAVEIAWECELPPPLPIAPGLADFGYCPWCVPAAACARVCQLSGVFPLPPGERTLKAPGVSLDLGGRGVPWTPPSGAMPPLAARCRAGQQLPKPRTAPHELPRRRSIGPFYRRLLVSFVAGLTQQPDAMLAMVAGHRDGLVQNSGFLPLG